MPKIQFKKRIFILFKLNWMKIKSKLMTKIKSQKFNLKNEFSFFLKLIELKSNQI